MKKGIVIKTCPLLVENKRSFQILKFVVYGMHRTLILLVCFCSKFVLSPSNQSYTSQNEPGKLPILHPCIRIFLIIQSGLYYFMSNSPIN